MSLKGRRVVVTGMSAVSAIGNSCAENWASLVEGRGGIQRISRFDCTPFKSQIAGEVKNLVVESVVPAKDIRTMDLFIQFALVACQEAMVQSGLIASGIFGESKIREEWQSRAAAIIGVGLGGLPEIEATAKLLAKRGPSRISPFFIPRLISNLAAGHAAIGYGLKAANFATTSACSSGAHAIGEGFRHIRHGYSDIALVGGAESVISELAVGGFDALRALSTRNEEPSKASRPFDRDRDGFVIGEGAGILVLEEYEFAKKRGAPILAELAGYGTSCDAYHMTSPSEGGQGAAQAMQWALDDAQIAKEGVGAVNAHGTSTPQGDIAETQAIKSVFGAHARRLKVSSTKSMTGHALGAAGGLEAVYTILALRNQVVPPTVNLDNADSQCDLDYVPLRAQDFKHEVALSNSFGFGGTNASLIFRRL